MGSQNNHYSDLNTRYTGLWDDAVALHQKNSQNALTRYNTGQAKLDKARLDSSQAAYINAELLKKYLPQQLQNQGLGGLGVSQSAMIDANNAYQRNLGSIDKTHMEQSTSLSEAYSQEQNDLDDTLSQTKQALWEGYYNEKSGIQQNNFDMIKDTIGKSSYTSQDDMKNLVHSFGDAVSEDQLASLLAYADMAANENRLAEEAALVSEIKTEIQTAIDTGDLEHAKTLLNKNKALLGNYYITMSTNVDSMKSIREAEEKAAQKAAEDAAEEEKIKSGDSPILNTSGDGLYYRLKKALKSDGKELKTDAFKEFIKQNGFSYAYDSKISDGFTVMYKPGKFVTYYKGTWYTSNPTS